MVSTLAQVMVCCLVKNVGFSLMRYFGIHPGMGVGFCNFTASASDIILYIELESCGNSQLSLSL